jgi:Spy/CpxP family protein refolding chaperone
MKRKMNGMSLGVLVLLLSFGFAVLSYAEGPGAGPGPMGRGDGAGFILKMKDKLGLTEDQVKQLQAVVESEKEEMGPLFEKISADRKALEDSLKAGAKDADLKVLLDNLEMDHQNIGTAGKRFRGQIRGILTPTQQAKIVVDRGQHRNGKGLKGPGRDCDEK